MRGLYAILDVPAGGLPDLVARATALLGRPGRRPCALQLRAKHHDTPARCELLGALSPVAVQAGVPLVVNDDADAALAGIEGVRGLHLGQDDPGASNVGEVRAAVATAGLADFSIGLSTHNLAQVRAAVGQPVDYIGFGPIRATASKVRHDPVTGLEGLLEACRGSGHPVVAIGGLDRELGSDAVRMGAAAVAMIGALRPPPESDTHPADHVANMAEALAEAAQPLGLDTVAAQVPVLPPDLLVQLAEWSDNIGVHIELGLPPRFRPRVIDGEVAYRPCDVIDLLATLGKREGETWADWQARMKRDDVGPLVSLRTV